jgi:transposase InsO family protein
MTRGSDQTSRPQQYSKLDDAEIIGKIREICDRRPTYGYRRVTAILNRKNASESAENVNHKKIYRIMSEQDMLLPKSGVRSERVHEGKIITLRSDTRWCSDGFEFRCFNREKGFVAFIEDTCDREAISWVASKTPITSESIRDLVVMAMERRFGNNGKPPHSIELLSDNGGCYRAEETKVFVRALGFIPCFTPSYSPESNGMSEALVKTMKRDYVWVSDRIETADQALAEIDGWFTDYNENHPHKGLKMKSPAEFRKIFSN